MLFGLLLLVCGYALRFGSSGFGDVLFKQHQCNVSPAMLSLNGLSLLMFVHVSVFGAVNAATVPTSAAVRIHDARIRIVAETDLGFLVVSGFGATGLINHMAEHSD